MYYAIILVYFSFILYFCAQIWKKMKYRIKKETKPKLLTFGKYSTEMDCHAGDVYVKITSRWDRYLGITAPMT